MNMDLEHLGQFLAEAKLHQMPVVEPSIFGVGGRGYYENATSDLLAFFLRPDAPHGFGTLFLRAFLHCIGGGRIVEHKLRGAAVRREVRTQKGGRIDIEVTGSDWCLLIENKIRHFLANPLNDYEAHASELGLPIKVFALLSPKGASEGNWQGVSYESYCSVTQQYLENETHSKQPNKWHFIACEFLLHLRNEICTPTMNEEQVRFFEAKFQQFHDVQRLAAAYRQHLRDCIGKRLAEAGIGDRVDVSYEENSDWSAYRCSCPTWNGTELVLFREQNGSGELFLRVYFTSPETRLRQDVDVALGADFRRIPEGKYVYWTAARGDRASSEAVSKLCELAQKVESLLGWVPPSAKN